MGGNKTTSRDEGTKGLREEEGKPRGQRGGGLQGPGRLNIHVLPAEVVAWSLFTRGRLVHHAQSFSKQTTAFYSCLSLLVRPFLSPIGIVCPCLGCLAPWQPSQSNMPMLTTRDATPGAHSNTSLVLYPYGAPTWAGVQACSTRPCTWLQSNGADQPGHTRPKRQKEEGTNKRAMPRWRAKKWARNRKVAPLQKDLAQ